MREPQNKRRSTREDRYCNWNIFCYVTDEHTYITLVVGVGEGCQEDTGGEGGNNHNYTDLYCRGLH